MRCIRMGIVLSVLLVEVAGQVVVFPRDRQTVAGNTGGAFLQRAQLRLQQLEIQARGPDVGRALVGQAPGSTDSGTTADCLREVLRVPARRLVPGKVAIGNGWFACSSAKGSPVHGIGFARMRAGSHQVVELLRDLAVDDLVIESPARAQRVWLIGPDEGKEQVVGVCVKKGSEWRFDPAFDPARDLASYERRAILTTRRERRVLDPEVRAAWQAKLVERFGAVQSLCIFRRFAAFRSASGDAWCVGPERQRKLPGSTALHPVAFTPDGRFLVLKSATGWMTVNVSSGERRELPLPAECGIAVGETGRDLRVVFADRVEVRDGWTGTMRRRQNWLVEEQPIRIPGGGQVASDRNGRLLLRGPNGWRRWNRFGETEAWFGEEALRPLGVVSSGYRYFLADGGRRAAVALGSLGHLGDPPQGVLLVDVEDGAESFEGAVLAEDPPLRWVQRQRGIDYVAFDADDAKRLWVCGRRRTARLDWDSGAVLDELPFGGGPLTSLVGGVVAIRAYNELIVAAGKPCQVKQRVFLGGHHSLWSHQIAVRRDHRMLAVAAEGSVLLLEVR